MYALLTGLPLILLGETPDTLSLSTLFFLAGIWIPGVFTAYLTDRFKRKNVYLFALLGCVVTTLPVLYVSGHPEGLCFLRFMQGACYGYALNLGNILTTDITSSPKRSRANSIFARLGRSGIWTGIAGAGVSYYMMGAEGIYFFALGCGILSVLCALMLSITFRAPLELPVVSTDRFFLSRTWPEALNLFFVSVIPGLFLSSVLWITFRFYADPLLQWVPWAAFIAGTLISFAIRHFLLNKQGHRLQTGISLVFLIIGCIVFSDFNSPYLFPVSLFLLGIGIETAASNFLYTFIRMSHHCERSTANTSYLFSWETGIVLGVCIGLHHYEQIGKIALFSILIAFLLYFAFTAKHYKIHQKR